MMDSRGRIASRALGRGDEYDPRVFLEVFALDEEVNRHSRSGDVSKKYIADASYLKATDWSSICRCCVVDEDVDFRIEVTLNSVRDEGWMIGRENVGSETNNLRGGNFSFRITGCDLVLQKVNMMQ